MQSLTCTKKNVRRLKEWMKLNNPQITDFRLLLLLMGCIQLSKHEVHWVLGFETVQMCFNISFLLKSIIANGTHEMVAILPQSLGLDPNKPGATIFVCFFSSRP